jgi:hypothetical protein
MPWPLRLVSMGFMRHSVLIADEGPAYRAAAPALLQTEGAMP